jgi:exopolysaccharide biosynthesis operon protein EpsL
MAASTRPAFFTQPSPPCVLSLLSCLLAIAMPSLALAQQSPIDPNWVQQPRLPDLPPLSTQLQLPDTLQFRVGQSIEHDSNIFRLPASSSRQADTYGVTTLGMKFDKRYGLQRIELELNAQDYRYKNYSVLDFTAINYAAAWRWSLTPRFTGNVTADRSEYIDNTSLVQSSGVVNHRTEEVRRLDGEYELGSAVRLLGGVFERNINNSTAASAVVNTSVTGADVGARYVFLTGNSVAYRYRKGNGEYTGLPSTTLPSRHFSDVEHELSFEATPTGRTTLQGRLAHLERKRDDSAGREFSGLVGRVNMVWAVTGKTRVEAGVIREISSYQPNAIIPSYYTSGRVYVSPVWNLTEKTAIRLRFDQGLRYYKGSLEPGYAGRRDSLSQEGVSLEWEPRRNLKLMASLALDKRSSNIQNLDYKANVLGLSALLKF